MAYIYNYFYNVMVAFSQLLNVIFLFGDPDESISGRIGKSYLAKGWAAKIPWPAFMLNHWVASVETDEGGNSAAKRISRD